MKILCVSTQDYLHHPLPSRHHYIFEELANRHEVHVPHFHVSRGKTRKTQLIVHEATKFTFREPTFHYTLNAPFHRAVFEKIIREEKIDVVVACHLFAGMAVIQAAKKHGVPVVFDLKDWLPDAAAAYYRNRVVRWLLRRSAWKITRYNLDKSDVITTVSPSLVERLKNFGFEARLITNGVNTKYFKPMDAKEGKRMLGLSKDCFVIGFIGSIEWWYSLDEVIRTLPEILHYNENVKLLIVGSSLFTDYEIKLKNLTRELRIEDKVIFAGVVEYLDLPKYISAMDVCLIPLAPPLWRNIALPDKFFEYSACGKPILLTPIPDVMKIGGEHLFTYKDRSDFIEKVRYIMDNPREYKIDIEEYDWQNKAKEFEELLEELVQKTGRQN